MLTCNDGLASVFAARTLNGLGYRHVAVLVGGLKAWRAAGHEIENGLTACWSEVDDVVLSPSITGDEAEMRRYLDWELRLKH